MELKHRFGTVGQIAGAAYNRTKVELKPWWGCNSLWSYCCLIIGPKWNWNSGGGGYGDAPQPEPYNRTKVELKPYPCLRIDARCAAYNRTKVELKHETWEVIIENVSTYNRTKVELKLKLSSKAVRMYERLIIGPKWNWNRKIWWLLTIQRKLIIGPKWNWNTLRDAAQMAILLLIIGPKWNWNHKASCNGCRHAMPYNRTKVELKPVSIMLRILTHEAYNRTKVELKP